MKRGFLMKNNSKKLTYGSSSSSSSTGSSSSNLNVINNNNRRIISKYIETDMKLLDSIFDELKLNQNKAIETKIIRIIDIGLVLEYLSTISDIVSFLSISKSLYSSRCTTPLMFEKFAVQMGIKRNKNWLLLDFDGIKLQSQLKFPLTLVDIRSTFLMYKNIPCCFKLNTELLSTNLSSSRLSMIIEQKNIDENNFCRTLYIQFCYGLTNHHSYSIDAFYIGKNPSSEVEEKDENIEEVVGGSAYQLHKLALLSESFQNEKEEYCLSHDLCSDCDKYRCVLCYDVSCCDLCEETFCSSCKTCIICDCCEMKQCSDCSEFLICSNTQCMTYCCNHCNDEQGFMTACDQCDKSYCEPCLDNNMISFCDLCEEWICKNCCVFEECDRCGLALCSRCHSFLKCGICNSNFCDECSQVKVCENCKKSDCDNDDNVRHTLLAAKCDKCGGISCFDCVPFFTCKICKNITCLECGIAICSVCKDMICMDCELMMVCLNSQCSHKICNDCFSKNSNLGCNRCLLLHPPASISCKQS